MNQRHIMAQLLFYIEVKKYKVEEDGNVIPFDDAGIPPLLYRNEKKALARIDKIVSIFKQTGFEVVAGSTPRELVLWLNWTRCRVLITLMEVYVNT